MKQEFKIIPWYEWLYEINTDWIIRSLPKMWFNWYHHGKILTPSQDKDWYLLVNLYKGTQNSKMWKVHRLVMFTFKWKSNLEINHINWIKWDNRLKNLEYCTRSENMKHAYINWFQTPTYKPITQYDLNGKYIKTWESLILAEKTISISVQSISSCLRWKTKTAGWYKWEYYITNHKKNGTN
jgi:hypothetical protein